MGIPSTWQIGAPYKQGDTDVGAEAGMMDMGMDMEADINSDQQS